jgi:glycosyltransferase involved in cell wall biosynthesis
MPWATTLDVVVPVFNEERARPGCIEVLSGYLTDRFPLETTITVVDNGSTDDTLRVAGEFASRTQLPVLWCADDLRLPHPDGEADVGRSSFRPSTASTSKCIFPYGLMCSHRAGDRWARVSASVSTPSLRSWSIAASR